MHHPTQALLDYFTLRDIFGDLKGKRITIIGDIGKLKGCKVLQIDYLRGLEMEYPL